MRGYLKTPNTGTTRVSPAVPSDDLGRSPCLFEVLLSSRSTPFSGLNAMLTARNASDYAVKAFGARAHVHYSDEDFTYLQSKKKNRIEFCYKPPPEKSTSSADQVPPALAAFREH
ncbi:hypothetical protein EVAR_32852_1 [Eumeta japonica]|uniref:Uncharacterized protein n=1 Tax=Eumeta variegata TaxID=151549 RepID=A0A4C1WC25_EUMVA|nr:hypothetical protein EVAR_32852_1 [Eumeta japonica]